MIDTNTIAAVNDTAQAAREVAQQWWPTLCAVAVIVARELRNFNAWLAGIVEWIIGHGGVGMIVRKLIWNPMNPDQIRAEEIVQRIRQSKQEPPK